MRRAGTRSSGAGVTVVQSEWLPRLVPALTVFEKPLDTPAPHYNKEVWQARRGGWHVIVRSATMCAA